MYKSWDVEADNGSLNFVEIPTRPCKREDFAFPGEDNSSSLFYPAKKTSEADLKVSWQKLKCVDRETELKMFGRYETQATQNIMVVFELCDPDVRSCKSEADIKKWMEFKYIIHVENIKRFIQHDFDDERIEMASVLKWHSVSPDVRTDTVNIIQRQNMIMNDYRMNVGSLMRDEEMGFETFQAPSRIMPYKNLFQNAITFELSLS